VSGVEAAIHGVGELWFDVGMEVSERDHNLAINTGSNGAGVYTICQKRKKKEKSNYPTHDFITPVEYISLSFKGLIMLLN